MNNVLLLAFLEDWQMSARLAKLSSLFSYDLIFYENSLEISSLDPKILVIIDIDNISKDEFQNLELLKEKNIIFIIGYCEKLDNREIPRLKKIGYDMIISHKNLLNNLEVIVKQIINAS